MTRAAFLVLILLTWWPVQAALAFAQVTVDMKNIHLDLVDLAADDGVSPSLSFDRTEAFVQLQINTTHSGSFHSNAYRDPGASNILSLDQSNSMVTGSILGSPVAVNQGLGDAFVSAASYGGGDKAFATVKSIATFFNISPMTKLTVTGDVSINAQTTLNDEALAGMGTMYLSFTAPGGATSQDESSYYYNFGQSHFLQIYNPGGHVSVSLSNLTTDVTAGYLEIGVSGEVFGSVLLTIPEPPIGLLFAVGMISILGVGARRSDRQSA
jgi:hypothetical protein